MATVVDYLGAGPEVLEGEKVSNVFPGANVGDSKRNIVDFQAEEVDDVRVDVRAIRDEFFQKALRQEVDINSMFPPSAKIDNSVVQEGIEAYKTIQSANTTGQILPNQQALDEKINLFKRMYTRSVPTSEKLSTGVYETGAFPIDASTNEMIAPESMKNVPAQKNAFTRALLPNTRTILEKKSLSEANFMTWSKTKADAPVDKNVLKSIARRLNPTMGANLARRTYEGIGFLKEGMGFYLPEIIEGGYNKVKGLIGADQSRDTWFSTDMEKELAEFRRDGAFGLSKLLPDADRHRIVNELVRDDYRRRLTPEEFERQGYNKKINVDGGEVYEKNFVTPKFANEVFEYAIDEMGFFQQVAVFIAEAAVTFKVATAPFVFGKRVNDGLNATQRFLHTKKYGANSQIPFKLNTIDKKLAASSSYALTHNVSVTEAARELALQSSNGGVLARFSANRIANTVNKRFNYENVKASMSGIQTKINEKGIALKDARVSGQTKYADQLKDELEVLKNNRNYQMYKLAGANAINFGLNPREDLTIAMVQATGRSLWANQEQGRDGAMGEGLAVAAYLLVGGVKKFYNYQSALKVPLIQNAVENKAFQVKLGIETLANFLLLGYGKGMLLNPDLTALNKLKDSLSITTSGIRTIDEFTRNALKLPKVQSDILVKNMMESIKDIHTITKDIPAQFQKGIRDKLVLSLADSAGISVFHGYAQDLKIKDMGFSKRDIKNFSRNVKNSIKTQKFGEERIAALSETLDGLKADILNMENVGGVAPEVISRLKKMASMYDSVNLNAISQFKREQAIEVSNIDNFISELENSSNADLLTYWTSGAGPENMLTKLFELRAKSVAYLTDSKTTSLGEADILIKQGDVQKSAANLVNTLTESNRRLKLTSNQSNSIDNANKTVLSLASVIESASQAKIINAYSQVDKTETIDFSNTGTKIFDLFEAYSIETKMSVTDLTNPRISSVLGGSTGGKLLDNLNGAAETGMLRLFNDPEIINIINKSGGTEFKSGNEILESFRIEANNNGAIRRQYGLTDSESMTNFQLLSYIKNKEGLAFNAEDLSFVASPQQFENLRQTMQVYAKNKNPTIKALGIQIVNLMDEDFRVWGQGTNDEAFNGVINARTIARLEKQRFDKNTVGDQILSLSDGSPIKFIGMDGKTTTITSKDATKIFDPLINAIINPNDKSAMFVENEMKRLVATFAPTATTLPDNLLVKVNGRYVEPTADQISSMVKPVFDLSTPEGKAGLGALSETLQALMYSRFVSSKGLNNVAAQIKKGEVPNLEKINLANATIRDSGGINLPKALPLPSGGEFKNYEDYIRKMEELITVNVKMPDGRTIPMPAFNITDMLRSEEHITNAIMSSKKFEDTHKDFVKLVKNEQTVNQSSTVKLFEEERIKAYENSRLYKDNMTGDSFYNDVIMQGNPNSVDKYVDDIDRLVDEGRMTLEQRDKTLQALVADVLRYAGGEEKNGTMWKSYTGKEIPISSYETPEIPFAILTGFDEVSETGVRTALSFQSEKFNKLMDAAGVTSVQKEVLVAMYRHGTKMDAQSVIRRASQSGVSAVGPNPGFTLNNTLSKAFNIARGMVSKEYVMAEMAIRYSAMADGAILNTIMNDERVASTILNLMNDPTRVLEADADYFVKAIIKNSATALRNTLNLEHDTHYNAENYWKSKNVVYPTTVKEQRGLR